MDDLQLQASTLKKLNQPSDDPVGASKILELRTEKLNNDQYHFNAKFAENFLTNSDHALAEMIDLVLRAKEIAINQSSATNSSEETRSGVAEEVKQLFEQAIGVGNRRVGDRYLFGGYKTQTPPVDAEGNYLGDNGLMSVETAHSIYVAMNIPGDEAFNTHPRPSASQGGYGDSKSEGNAENVNVFDELQKLRIAVLTGDREGIHDTLDRFDQIHSKLVATRVKIGTRVQGLQTSSQALERHNVTNAVLSSSLEDADMAKVMSDLGKEETVFRNSLASSKRLIQPTLLDFLK